MFIPDWLREAMGNRERAIAQASDARPVQCLPGAMEPEECRLPPHQRYIVSLSQGAYFIIDTDSRKIIG